uniref:type II protein arginine methyltransferase n=1 Tax=Aureoumbra lagunensis TaxID=44058 RepID=A0A7S3K0C6_9STRA
MSFYDRKGVKSWSQGIVPHFITCNAFIGRAYAKVLIGFIRDCMASDAKIPLDPSEPLYIVELGAGSGKFSFFMLKALNAMLGSLSNFNPSRIVYVMTDFTQNNLNFWNQHPGLRPYIESGQLDLAIFDAVNDETIQLHHSKTILKPGSMQNPICIVANYLFDTLCHDIFQVENHQLKEGLISVGSRHPFEPDALDPEIIKRFDNHFRYRIVDEHYYSDEDQADVGHYKRILRWYLDYFGASPSGASILMPVGALRALRRLTAFSKGRALVLSGDKGNNNPEQFRGLMDPHIAVHGSFSVMVNYHAIGLYFISRNGFVLHNPQEEASLKVSAFILTGDDDHDDHHAADAAWANIAPPQATNVNTQIIPPPKSSFPNQQQHNNGNQNNNGDAMSTAPSPGSILNPSLNHNTKKTKLHCLWTGDEMERISCQRALSFSHLCRVFEDEIVRFGPNDFFVLQKSMKEDSQQPTLKGIVALLKLGDWDPDVFYKFRDVILNQAPVCGCKLRNDLCRDLPRVWDNYYSLDKDKDVSFEVGRFYYGIREHEKALQFYRISTEHIGEHHVTFHNMGLCHYSLGQLDTALEHFEKSLGLNANYEKARSWHQKVSREFERQQQIQIGGTQSHNQAIQTNNSPDMMIDMSTNPQQQNQSVDMQQDLISNHELPPGTPPTADGSTFYRKLDDLNNNDSATATTNRLTPS